MRDVTQAELPPSARGRMPIKRTSAKFDGSRFSGSQTHNGFG
jgi:hypothetical protein